MTVPVIKALTKRIRLRIGSTDAAAQAAGVSKSGWSDYENADKPETTIPVHRLLGLSLTAAERREVIALFTEPDDDAISDLMDEAAEATESAVNVQRMVRLATRDGIVTESERRPIRAAALDAKAHMDDVLRAVS